MIYLDHAATTPMLPRVFNEMVPFLTDQFGNPSSLHSYGTYAAKAVASAREQVAALFNCEPKQIIFTSGGTEANNLVFQGLVSYLGFENRPRVGISNIEHDSVCEASKRAGMMGLYNSVYRYNDTADFFTTPWIGLISMMALNNEIGFAPPIEELSELAHSHNALFHTDCVQAAGYLPLDMNSSGLRHVDFATISSHKIGGPKGVGAVFVRDPDMLSPVICGGPHQEFGLRGGTENVAGIVGFGAAAAEIAGKEAIHRMLVDQATTYFVELLKHRCCENHITGVSVYGDQNNGRKKVVCVRVGGCDAQSLVLMMSKRGVCISAGSACHANSTTPSRVLMTFGFSEESARECVRFSFSHTTLLHEVETAVETFVDAIKDLRSLAG